MNILKKLLYFILGVFTTIGGLSLMVLALYIKDLRDDNNAWKEYSKRRRYYQSYYDKYKYRRKEEQNDSTDNR